MRMEMAHTNSEVKRAYAIIIKHKMKLIKTYSLLERGLIKEALNKNILIDSDGELYEDCSPK